jgi:hypothetical protein
VLVVCGRFWFGVNFVELEYFVINLLGVLFGMLLGGSGFPGRKQWRFQPGYDQVVAWRVFTLPLSTMTFRFSLVKYVIDLLIR